MPALTWYNGWSPEQRRATIPLQRAALASGRIPRPSVCSICGFDDPPTRGGWNYLQLHDERYDRWWEPYELCRHCHYRVHDRFSAPAWWLRYLARVGHDGWAATLSLDPASQWWPYEQTYPHLQTSMLSVGKEHCWVDAEGIGDTDNDEQAGVSLTPLNPTQVGEIDANFSSELFLSEAASKPKLPNAGSKSASPILHRQEGRAK